jgi:hypothetical protein
MLESFFRGAMMRRARPLAAALFDVEAGVGTAIEIREM